MKTVRYGLILFLILLAASCGEEGGTAGTGGEAGSGGAAGTGGAAGAGGVGGEPGTGGSGGTSGSGGSGGSGGATTGPPQMLSEWGLFKSIPDQIPEDGVLPYDVTSPLFTDYAAKFRFVRVPEGEKLKYSDTGRWLNPTGTIYIKTFAYPVDERTPELGYQLIETRLLVFGENGVDTWTYVYPTGDNTDAERINWGPMLDVSWTNASGETTFIDYAVPSVPQCKECHGVSPTRSLGPSTGMLNRNHDYGAAIGVVNQIDYMDSLGLFDTTPSPVENRTTFVSDPSIDTEAGLHDRARSYFDSNCSHCHAPDGEVSDKGLYLDYESMDPDTGTTPFTWGVCKVPTSGGNGLTCDQSLDVVPGEPSASFLLCRMESIAAGERMAPLGRTIVHAQGVELVRQWIEELPSLFPGIGSACQ